MPHPEGNADDLRRIDDAFLNHVTIYFFLGVKTVVARLLHYLAYHNRAFDAGVLGDLTDRSFERAAIRS